MRTKRANRYNKQHEHNQFGIYNWFRLKGITDKDVMKETIHNFCKDKGFDMEGFIFSGAKEKEIFNWVADRFQVFGCYAGEFLKDNNYIPTSHQKV